VKGNDSYQVNPQYTTYTRSDGSLNRITSKRSWRSFAPKTKICWSYFVHGK